MKIVILIALAMPAQALAECKYQKLVPVGGMTQKEADSYCKFEAAKALSEATLRKESARCHSATDPSKLSACLQSANIQMSNSLQKAQQELAAQEAESEQKQDHAGKPPTTVWHALGSKCEVTGSPTLEDYFDNYVGTNPTQLHSSAKSRVVKTEDPSGKIARVWAYGVGRDGCEAALKWTLANRYFSFVDDPYKGGSDSD